jgi:hypothetical protein
MSLVAWPLRIAVCVALLVAAAPASTPASDPGDAAPALEAGPTDPGDVDPEKWWGALGAAMCGAGFGLIRYYPPVGMHPAILAATIGGCLLALLDIAD